MFENYNKNKIQRSRAVGKDYCYLVTADGDFSNTGYSYLISITMNALVRGCEMEDL